MFPTARPGKGIHTEHQDLTGFTHAYNAESDTTDTDSDESLVNDLPVVKVRGPENQSVGLWSYLRHDNIAIFKPKAKSLLKTMKNFAVKYLGYEPHHQKLMILYPGQLTPSEVKDKYDIRPGSVVMVMPSSKKYVKVEINQMKSSFSLLVDATSTVYKVKCQVKRFKGIPIHRQEILFKEKVLENNRRLFEYRVRNKSTLYVMILAHFDILINVYTFWGKVYRFYMDPCNTGIDVIHAIFTRTFSKDRPKDAGTHEYCIPLHNLVLSHNEKLVVWDSCLANQKVKSGSNLLLTTVAYQNATDLQQITVTTENGERYHVIASKYDRWSVVSFILHGLTNVPVDLMQIYKNEQQMNLSTMVGHIPPGTSIVMNVVMTHIKSDVMFGVPLWINIGNGITENIKIAANKTVRSAKKKLERLGVPYATMYELVAGNNKISNTSRIYDVIYDMKSPLFLKLEKFPIFVHTPDGVIYKTYIDVKQTIGQFKQKMQLKSGKPMTHTRIIMSGVELIEHENVTLYDAGVNVRSSLFILPDYEADFFFIHGINWMIKLKFPSVRVAIDIRDTVRDDNEIPEQCINCLLTFLYWYHVPRFLTKYRVKPKPQSMARMPKAEETLYPMAQLLPRYIFPNRDNQDKRTLAE
ncbi:hypothetical protein FSP39_014487 [Pinctada imbricata]|uniref:Ubiquitin-like domain-containing protein n=1 Tax=Pinctada imbricata TaxID=66713 RepID=A0AA88YN53_PINIB|nr:hypothetical protein FSP39_014487 [Pinctada imbricata]